MSELRCPGCNRRITRPPRNGEPLCMDCAFEADGEKLNRCECGTAEIDFTDDGVVCMGCRKVIV